jgi:hypothetical protein
MAGKKGVNPFAKFEKADKAKDKSKGVKENSKKDSKVDNKFPAFLKKKKK